MTNARTEKKGVFAFRPALARLVARKRFFARTVLLSEQLLPGLLPMLCVVALFLATAWFGLFRIMPGYARPVALAIFVLAFVASVVPLLRLRWPSVAAADRLLEERNGLSHQPVAVQEDQPAFDTPFSRALWHEHQLRMAERIASLDAGTPRPDIASHDRFALRAIPALLLAVAFGFSGSNSGGSIADAFRMTAGGSGNADLRIDAWVTPPTYTGQPPTYLKADAQPDQRTLNVPQFSELTVRVTGGDSDAKVLFKAAGSDEAAEIPQQEQPLAKNAPAASTAASQTAAAQTPSAAPAPMAVRTHALSLEKGGMLSVGDRQWTFAVAPDKPPEIAFDGIPRGTANGSLEIKFAAKDDYGVDEAHAEIVAVDAAPDAKPLYAPPDFKFDIPRRSRSDTKGVASHDLTSDPLAGKRVRITLVARDGAGQTGRSPPYEMTLPGRTFNEPLAAAVAEERQTFALDTRRMPDAIALNEALTLRADETIPNLTNYLLLRSARTRMKLAANEEALKDTADYLWQIALGMEDGQLSDAEKKLRDAQQKLSDALKRNAPDSEIKQLMAELRKAMDGYMKELAQRLQNSPNQPNQKNAKILRQQDLARMMDQIENLARSGNRDAAQQMLSELQRMMNNMQAGKPRQDQQQGQENSQARQQMDKLGQILRDQQKLMDQTFRLDQAMKDRQQQDDSGEDGDPLNQPMPDQNGQTPPQPKAGQQPTDQMTADQLREALKQLRKQQDDLSKQLGELQKGLGELGVKPGPGFGQAQKEMDGAAGELGKGRGEQAMQGQGRAMEALRQGARDMMSQMGQGKGQQGSQGQQLGQGGQNGRDPLGRSRQEDGPDDMGESLKIPDIIDVQRAREILDAIRERLGNNPTQQEERQYLERLLGIQ